MSYTAILEVQTNASLVPSPENDGESISQQGRSAFIIRGRKVSSGSRSMRESGSPLDQYANDLESGDQLICMNGSYQKLASASFRSGPPKAGIIKIPLASSAHREKAISDPSGDHAALIQWAGWLVN